MRLNALTRCGSRFRRSPLARPAVVQAEAHPAPIILLVEVVPGFMAGSGQKLTGVRDKVMIAKLVADGRLNLDCAEGAMGMDGAGDGFPIPGTPSR